MPRNIPHIPRMFSVNITLVWLECVGGINGFLLSAVYPSQHSADESSNDEASDDSGPILRRRRSKRSTLYVPECENKPTSEEAVNPEPKTQAKAGNNLNKCIILALVIAISMGFGHFYGKYSCASFLKPP